MRKGAQRLLAALSASLILVFSLRPAAAGINQWTPVGPGGGMVISVAAHPDQAGLVFAGTARSVYRSTNNGQTWTAVRNDIPNGIKRILIDPSNTSRVFALSGHAVYRSDDSGVSFGASGSPVAPIVQLTSMAIASDGTLYVGVSSGRVFRASNLNPLQWEELSVGLPTDSEGGVNSLTIDPQDENFLYAITTNGRVYKTANGGGSWSQLATFPNAAGRNIAVDPGSSSDLLAATGLGLFTSPDGGASWTLIQYGRFDWVGYHPAGSGAAVALSANGTALRRTARAAGWTIGHTLKTPYLPDASYDPLNADVSNSTLWVATTDGPQLTQDSAATFQIRSQGILASSVRQLGTAQGTIYALFASGPSGLYRRNSLASGWEAVDNTELRTRIERPFEPTAVAADAQQPNSLFVFSGTSLVFSSDGGGTWTQPAPEFASPNNVFASSLAIDPSDSQTVYLASSSDGFYRSTNRGGTWFQPSASLPQRLGAIAVDPGTPGTVYVSALDAPGVYKTVDGGDTWSAASTGLAGTVLSLSIDPSDPLTIYATSLGATNIADAGLYRTVNGGQTWAKVPGAAAATSQAARNADVDPVVPTNLVLSMSSLGIPIRSVDGGAAWENLSFSSEDDRFITWQILFDPLRPHVVLAGTEHFGLMEYEISPDLRVAITSAPAAVPLGGNAPATVRVESSVGEHSASAVELTLTMPAGMTAEVPSPSQGTCSAAARVVTCAIGVVRPGQPVDISLLIHGDATPGQGTWSASVAAHESDSDTTNNSVTGNLQLAAVADLRMAFNLPAGTLDRGASMQLTATASNQGPNSASGVVLSVTLPARLTFQSGMLSTGGSCSRNGNTVECAVGVLGAAQTATATVNVVGALAGTDSVTAQVSSTSIVDIEQSNNAVSQTIEVRDPVSVAPPPPANSGGGGGGGHLGLLTLLGLILTHLIRRQPRRTSEAPAS